MQKRCETELGCLRPKLIRVWWVSLFDIFHPVRIEGSLSKLLYIPPPHVEFATVPVYCTVKPTPPLRGQAIHNRTNSKRKSHDAPCDGQYNSVLILRGPFGLPVLVEATFS